MNDLTNKLTNKSIVMAVRILDELAADGHELGVTELATRLGEQKGRVHRHLATLRENGMVSQSEAGERYRLGWKLLKLGIAADANLDLRVLAKRHIFNLRESTEQTVVLAVPAGINALTIDCLPSESPVAVVIKKGVLFRSNTSSLARVLLAFANEDLQAEFMVAPTYRHTEFSLVDPTLLKSRLKLVRDRFFEIAVNEDIYGVAAISAPIFGQNNAIAGAVGIVGSQFYISEDPAFEMVSKVQHTAASISSDLNSSAWSDWRTR